MFERTSDRSARHNREHVLLVTSPIDPLRCIRSSSSSRATRPGSSAVRATGFQMHGRRSPMRMPAQFLSAVSSPADLYERLPWRQNMIGCDKANGHRKQQDGSNQTRGRRRRNIKQPASGADYQAEKKSDDRSNHFFVLSSPDLTAKTFLDQGERAVGTLGLCLMWEHRWQKSESSRRNKTTGDQIHPSSFMAHPACQIFVICRIFSPSNSITYT